MVRGLRAALNASGRYKFVEPHYAVDHVVVGGGVVGLAIAARLSLRYGDKSTVLLERHETAAQETSSRNSEVIHAGIYYAPDSLKTRLCLRGRHLLKEYCTTHSIPHAFPGKLVFGSMDQREYLTQLHAHCQGLSPTPRTHLLSGDEARALQPDLSRDVAGAVHSVDTGIIDSHSLVQALESEVHDASAGDLAYKTRVVRVDPRGDEGWVVQVVTGTNDGPGDAILARTLINSSGLNANLILNSLLDHDQRIPLYFARGSYASYHGSGVQNVNMLLYPVPTTKKSNVHAFHSLGTHLTLDLEGNIRFGPDLEWIEPPGNGAFSNDEEHIDFWAAYHRPEDSAEKLKEIYEAVVEYLPGISLHGLRTDYAGIRPKISGPNSGFQDFVFRVDRSSGQNGYGAPLLTLLGIESPGLTSALAIAEHVDGILYPE